MRQYWALTWNVRPGTEQAVRDLFASYGRPDHTVRDPEGNELGTLISTQVFMKDNTIVRVVETDVEDLRVLAQHMGRQPAIRDLEMQLDQYLEKPRDMSNPQGAAQFFRETAMDCLVSRRHDEE
jgi:hypothetical protein